MHFWFYISGPSSGIEVWAHPMEIDSIVERLCHLTGDDEYEYTATRTNGEYGGRM